ncbi:MAG: hypothetical protein GY835_28175 [bacterium]|nr:hypothetical protein [bacterium]
MRYCFFLLALLLGPIMAMADDPDDQYWHALSEPETGTDGKVLGVSVYDDKLAIGGGFSSAGGMGANNVALWDGANWQQLGVGTGEYIQAVIEYGGELVAGGHFEEAGEEAASRVAAWDGIGWHPLGSGTDNSVYCLAVYEGDLVAAGRFNSAGGVAAPNIARWDGSSWHTVGELNDGVYALTVYDGKLIAGGWFTHAGGVEASSIASWDGATWQQLGAGIGGTVYALAVYDDNLIAGGSFEGASGVVVNNIARWDGSTWHPLGVGMNTTVRALTVYGDELIAGGYFTAAGGVSASHIARWDGTAWYPLGSGVIGSAVYALTVYDCELIAAGNFASAGGVTAHDVARWSGPPFCLSLDIFGIDGETSLDNVVGHWPVFFWSYRDTLEYVQTEFEIEVGSDDDWTLAELWSPPSQVTSDTYAIYAGNPLVDGDTYFTRFRSYDGIEWSPWFETSFSMNTAPDVPAVLSPEDGGVSGSIPELWLTNASDPEADSLSYDFELYMDIAMQWIVKDTQGVPETTDSTGWNTGVTLTDNEPFWWRTRSYDGYEYSEWSDLAVFYVNGTDQPPTAPVTILPPDTSGLPVWDMLPTFTWSESSDPDPFDTLFHYVLEIAVDSNFTYKNDVDSIWATNYELADSLTFGTRYWWRVSACDHTDLCTVSEPGNFWTWTLGDMDHSHVADITDLSILIDNQFLSLSPIYPAFVADVTGDCQVDITDISRFIDHLFLTLGPLEVGCE